MEENKEEIQEAQETPEQNEAPANNSDTDEGSGFDLKAALPVLLTVVVVIILFFKMVIPALDPADHSPSKLIEETQDGKYYNDFVDRFK